MRSKDDYAIISDFVKEHLGEQEGSSIITLYNLYKLYRIELDLTIHTIDAIADYLSYLIGIDYTISYDRLTGQRQLRFTFEDRYEELSFNDLDIFHTEDLEDKILTILRLLIRKRNTDWLFNINKEDYIIISDFVKERLGKREALALIILYNLYQLETISLDTSIPILMNTYVSKLIGLDCKMGAPDSRWEIVIRFTFGSRHQYFSLTNLNQSILKQTIRDLLLVEESDGDSN